jgi:hypothetical protein
MAVLSSKAVCLAIRSRQYPHRQANGQVHLVVDDEDVVATIRMVGVQPERVRSADVIGVTATELAVCAGASLTPLPLLADHLERHGLW